MNLKKVYARLFGPSSFDLLAVTMLLPNENALSLLADDARMTNICFAIIANVGKSVSLSFQNKRGFVS